MNTPATFSVFQGDRMIAAGSRDEARAAVREAGSNARVLVFEDATGAQIDLDVRDTDDAISGAISEAARGRGRPRLGVTPREVTLLPRHWDWLAQQPGGASVALRRLVEEASRSPAERRRVATKASYAFMHAIAGDRPGYEEALRSLFAGDRERFEAQIAAWPVDVRAYAVRLAFPD
jgi:hypothetical protein